MKEVDEIYNELRSEYHQGSHANPERIKELQTIFEKSKKEARELAMSNEMDQAIERAGGTGLNATTSVDATRYYYSLPSNKIELFFALNY